MTCADGHHWTGGGGSFLVQGRVRRLRWLWLPVDLLRMVLDHRSMVPVPLTYVSAVVAGGVLGAAFDLVLGWSWWLVAIGFVAALWLFFFASALWGPDPVRRDDVHDVIDPQGVEARQFARLEEAMLTGQLVGFEVANWTGSRTLGGWGGSSHPEQVTLRHDDPERDNTWVSITTRCGRPAAVGLDWRKDHLFEELVRSEEQPPGDLDAEDQHRWHIDQERRIEEAKRVEWSTTTMTIDGTPIPCDVIHRADRWVAVGVSALLCK